jgi:hypothetical protein
MQITLKNKTQWDKTWTRLELPHIHDTHESAKLERCFWHRMIPLQQCIYFIRHSEHKPEMALQLFTHEASVVHSWSFSAYLIRKQAHLWGEWRTDTFLSNVELQNFRRQILRVPKVHDLCTPPSESIRTQSILCRCYPGPTNRYDLNFETSPGFCFSC